MGELTAHKVYRVYALRSEQQSDKLTNPITSNLRSPLLDGRLEKRTIATGSTSDVSSEDSSNEACSKSVN